MSERMVIDEMESSAGTECRIETGKAGPPRVDDSAIQDASAWVLRIGVVVSVGVMLVGIVISYLRHTPTVAQMESVKFDDHVGALVKGVAAGHGRSIVEVGILLLVLTPILRVATSMVLFWFGEKDRFYAAVTLVVLILTLVSLLLIR